MAFDKKTYDREYHKAHRDKVNAATKRWRDSHPEEWRKRNAESHRKWRLKNKEQYNAYQREWRAKKKALAENESK